MRPPAQMKWRSDPNFSRFRIGRRELVLHRELVPQAAQIVQQLGALTSAPEAGTGNRQSGFRIDLEDGHELFARRSRRGGLIGSILSDVYLGMTPRPLTELAVTLEARRREIPVVEAMGAMVEWLGPALYRGFFLTRAVRGMTLWEFVKTDDDPTVRSARSRAGAHSDRHDARQGPFSRRPQSAQPAGDASAREFHRDYYRPRQIAALRQRPCRLPCVVRTQRDCCALRISSIRQDNFSMTPRCRF